MLVMVRGERAALQIGRLLHGYTPGQKDRAARTGICVRVWLTSVAESGFSCPGAADLLCSQVQNFFWREKAWSRIRGGGRDIAAAGATSTGAGAAADARPPASKRRRVKGSAISVSDVAVDDGTAEAGVFSDVVANALAEEDDGLAMSRYDCAGIPLIGADLSPRHFCRPNRNQSRRFALTSLPLWIPRTPSLSDPTPNTLIKTRCYWKRLIQAV